MKIFAIIIFLAISCYGQVDMPYDNITTGGESSAWAMVSTTITMGSYTFEQDSIATMTNEELDNFIVLFSFFTNGWFWNDDVIDKLCLRLLPERLRIKE